MIDGKKILGIIPARGGSKGIPRKNIKQLAGKPLLAWTIEESKKSKYIDRIILSSEDVEIIKVAKNWGCEVPFVRPDNLAQDDTAGIEPVIHAINTLTEKFDYLCLLQPTSPLRKVEDIDSCIDKCISAGASSCVSISEVDQHPFWMYNKDEDDKLLPFLNNNVTRRQELPKVYSLNGAIYFNAVSMLISEKQFINNETIGYIMNKEDSIDIDTQFDFNVAKILIENES